MHRFLQERQAALLHRVRRNASTTGPFLASKGHAAAEVEKMYAAWLKSCLLQMTLWTYPYIKEGDF